jgi:ribosomal protein L11 methyltransferase
MEYIQLSFPSIGAVRDILIARLAEAGCEGFEETDDMLVASMPLNEYNEQHISEIATANDVTFTKSVVQQQNWNALWESSFEPVVVPGFCTVRASFHPTRDDTPYEIIITPKMSFGTGHHATTKLMMTAMKDMNLSGASVFDFGTGTGILAILASKLGAATVMAIDNDEWSVDNALENIESNGVKNVSVEKGSLEIVQEGARFDIVLANINRHILLQYMQAMHSRLATNGQLLLSGILKNDEPTVVDAAERVGFVKVAALTEGDWIALKFTARQVPFLAI